MTDDAGSVVLSQDTLSLVEDLRETRDAIKVLKAREESIRTVLLTELDGVEYGVTAAGAPVIEVQRQPRSRVDSKKLQALYEDVWKDCQTETEVEVLRFPETLEA
jgi:predicted phage-related endonuclease